MLFIVPCMEDFSHCGKLWFNTQCSAFWTKNTFKVNRRFQSELSEGQGLKSSRHENHVVECFGVHMSCRDARLWFPSVFTDHTRIISITARTTEKPSQEGIFMYLHLSTCTYQQSSVCNDFLTNTEWFKIYHKSAKDDILKLS